MRNLKFIWLCILVLMLVVSTVWGASEFDKLEPLGTRNVSDLDYYIAEINNEAFDRVLTNYVRGANLEYNSISSITIQPGEIICSNSTGTVRKFRKNTSSINTTWSVATNGLDAGAETGSTTYTVYAIADADAETFTVLISASSTSPTGATSYKKLGTFYNNSSSNIDRDKIHNVANHPVMADSSGKKPIQAIYSYTDASSFTSKTGDLKVAYGSISVAGANTTTISNLPFTSASTYTCVASHTETGDLAKAACDQASASTLVIRNEHPDARVIGWVAIGY